MASKIPALEKKIIELDPYKASVTAGNDSQVVPDDSSVAWEPDDEPSSDSAWVAASVKTGDTGNARYTVRLPLPSAGKGLEANKEGVIDVKYDADTMEVTETGELSAKVVLPAGLKCVDGDFRVTDTPYRINLSNAKCDGLYKQDDDYGGRRLGRGEIVVPGKYKWIKVDGFLAFTVRDYQTSKWEYDCQFGLDVNNRVDIKLDTTEQHTVIPFTTSICNMSGNPLELLAQFAWLKDVEDDVGVTCGVHMTITAN